MRDRRNCAVVIMAKAPRPGEVKTRLCPPLSPDEAAELYRCFLLDKMEQVKAFDGAAPAVAYSPDESKTLFETIAPSGFTLIPQKGADLGARLAGTIGHLLGAGYPKVMAIDSDTPTLPVSHLQLASTLLDKPEVDVVLGPSEDGGYYLIGQRTLHQELFDGINWSTAQVLTETIQRADAKGLKVACLPAWYDVDRPEELERLKVSLNSEPGQEARHTMRFFIERGEVKDRRRLAETSWRTLSSREIYRNRWLSLREDQVALPDGREGIYGVVSCGHCVGVLPFLDPDTVLLVKQYRYVAKRVTWEMPTGGVHQGESVEEAAQRELGEEIGYRAGSLVRLSTYHTSKSVMDETAHLFMGEDLARLELNPDETEFIEVRPFPFRRVLEMVLDGEILDSMTVIAVLHAARRLGV